MSNKSFKLEREKIVNYLRKELIGPVGAENETMKDKPHIRYLAGTLFPQDAQIEITPDDDVTSSPAGEDEKDDDSPLSLIFQDAPASMGFSFFYVRL
ncbi:hypothetical protein OAJ43_04255 [Nitrosomonadales bacterium]|nr:hypothetical protein [Nitrosomonadales bacterium]